MSKMTENIINSVKTFASIEKKIPTNLTANKNPLGNVAKKLFVMIGFNLPRRRSKVKKL